MNTRIVERSILHHTNKEQRRHRVKPLKGHRALIRGARAHSRWMARRGVMSHTGVGSSEPYQRARTAGFLSNYVGENLWQSSGSKGIAWKSNFRWRSDWQLGKAAVISWMNSPGHRKNLLTADYTHIGIGVGRNKRNRIYLTQKFGKAPSVPYQLRKVPLRKVLRREARRRKTRHKLLFMFWISCAGLLALALVFWAASEVRWFDILTRLVDYIR